MTRGGPKGGCGGRRGRSQKSLHLVMPSAAARPIGLSSAGHDVPAGDQTRATMCPPGLSNAGHDVPAGDQTQASIRGVFTGVLQRISGINPGPKGETHDLSSTREPHQKAGAAAGTLPNFSYFPRRKSVPLTHKPRQKLDLLARKLCNHRECKTPERPHTKRPVGCYRRGEPSSQSLLRELYSWKLSHARHLGRRNRKSTQTL